MFTQRGRWLYIGRIRLVFERNWRSRPYPYWFNAKYENGMRRICLPYLCLDINHNRKFK